MFGMQYAHCFYLSEVVSNKHISFSVDIYLKNIYIFDMLLNVAEVVQWVLHCIMLHLLVQQ